MAGGISPTVFHSRLGRVCVFAFGMMCGVEQLFLKSSFLELYLIACDKEALLLDYLDSFSAFLPTGI
jgi:hypothetical protein